MSIDTHSTQILLSERFTDLRHEADRERLVSRCAACPPAPPNRISPLVATACQTAARPRTSRPRGVSAGVSPALSEAGDEIRYVAASFSVPASSGGASS